MTKTNSLLTNLKKAYKRLAETLKFSDDMVHRDAAIQRFEFNFELCWKLMQAIAVDNGLTSYGPRNSIRSAARLGLIDEPEKWLNYLDKRNSVSHMYKEKEAERVHKSIAKFVPLVKALIDSVSEQTSVKQ